MEIADLLLRQKVRSSVAACTRCSLHKTAVAPVPFSGPSPCNIVVLGEAPGRTEDERGEPFVGASGRLLRAVLVECGYDLAQIAFVNAVCCFPNRTPTAGEIDACEPNLVSQLEAINPSYIIAFGGIAVSALRIKPVRMGDIRGTFWRPTNLPLFKHIWCIGTWHPAAILRNASLTQQWREDLDYARLITREEMVPELSQYCLKCGDVRVEWDDDLPWCEKHK